MTNDIKNLWKKNASEIIQLIEKKEISPLEVMDSSLNRIEKVNPDINAIVTIIENEAKENLIQKASYNTKTKLKSMPVFIKDMNDVKNVRTTYGSKLYADHFPKESDIVVETI